MFGHLLFLYQPQGNSLLAKLKKIAIFSNFVLQRVNKTERLLTLTLQQEVVKNPVLHHLLYYVHVCAAPSVVYDGEVFIQSYFS